MTFHQAAFTKHADCRAQQRRIDPLIIEWLDRFGEEEYTSTGCVRVYFSKQSIRKMERAFGREPVSRMKDKLGVYRVESNADGRVITTGWRTKRFRRK